MTRYRFSDCFLILASTDPTLELVFQPTMATLTQLNPTLMFPLDVIETADGQTIFQSAVQLPPEPAVDFYADWPDLEVCLAEAAIERPLAPR